ncbi:hypothetical protein ACFP3H_09915 [Nocardia lasii]|uniref:Uncharacterized protein n=1 Tax=Nocardia lasii TaxID=1616107 RepID=A0ABW1JQS7_9NOCA
MWFTTQSPTSALPADRASDATTAHAATGTITTGINNPNIPARRRNGFPGSNGRPGLPGIGAPNALIRPAAPRFCTKITGVTTNETSPYHPINTLSTVNRR